MDTDKRLEHEQFLIDMVRKAWEGKKGVLLAYLGQEFSDKYDPYARLYGKGLKASIGTEGLNELDLLPHPTIVNRELVMLAEEAAKVRELPPNERLVYWPTKVNADETDIRYRVGIWTAFKHDLPEGQRRWLTPAEPHCYRDRDVDAPAEEGGIEVKRSEIPKRNNGFAVSDADVAAAIKQWLKLHPRMEASFLESPRSNAVTPHPRRAGRVPKADADWNCTLDTLEELFADGDAERVLVPLDVVLRLARRLSQRG